MKLTLKEWRRAKGISQKEMAELCGVHPNTYRLWEENPANIKLAEAIKIADRIGIAVEDLIFAQ
jgi:transcriptional regulator with XRE-family HTH domain